MTAPLHVVDDTASTQDDARALVAAGCVHGTAVVAKRQHSGRGRRGRSWFAGEHGLWLSVVLHVEVPVSRAPRIPIAACVAIAEALDATVGAAAGAASSVFIKWPNDLLVPAADTGTALGPFRKAGGLIVEAVDVDATTLKTCVLGVGINVRAPDDGFPDDVTATAGHLARAFDDDARVALARAVVASLLDIGARVDDDAFEHVLTTLKARSATLKRRVTVEGITGRAIDFDHDGALVVLADDGRRHTIRAGDVALIG
ncbi:MAG TPA: biotin--[acetyl-CoA-carboxylase] ligase [Myxococcota bacterium]